MFLVVRHAGTYVVTHLTASLSLVFDLNADPPAEVAVLIANDGTGAEYHGYTVAIGGGRAAVGAFSGSVSDPLTGRVFIFEQGPGGPGDWTQTAMLAETFDGLPVVAMDEGDRLVVGCPSCSNQAGEVSVYEWDINSFQLFYQLTKSTASQPGDFFGQSVDLSCGTIIGEILSCPRLQIAHPTCRVNTCTLSPHSLSSQLEHPAKKEGKVRPTSSKS